jgi:hypothetical protein
MSPRTSGSKSLNFFSVIFVHMLGQQGSKRKIEWSEITAFDTVIVQDFRPAPRVWFGTRRHSLLSGRVIDAVLLRCGFLSDLDQSIDTRV